MRKGSVSRSCRPIGSKILVVVWFTRDFSQGIEGHYVRPWSLNLLFCRRGFGLVVSVVVPLMLAVLPYARGCGFKSRSRFLFIVWTYLCFSPFILYTRCTYDKKLEMIQPLVQEFNSYFYIFGFGPGAQVKSQIGPKFVISPRGTYVQSFRSISPAVPC
jgi:hypothetical protein